MPRYTKDVLAEKAEECGWSIGDFSYGSPTVQQWGNDGRLIIGRYCSMAGGVKILLGGNHRTDWLTTYPFNVLRPAGRHISGHPATRGDVVIGNDVWIGQEAVIVSGVTIGDGACIGTRAVVVRDVPPYSIVAGNPGHVVRRRFTDVQISRMIEIQWWNWSVEKIDAEIPALLSGDIEGFISKHQAAAN